VTTDDHSFRRPLTQAVKGGGDEFGVLGAHAMQWATRTRHSNCPGCNPIFFLALWNE